MRLANQALILLSPVILVHLLSVAEFGRYREFLLYVGLLTALGAFGIKNSLLYFVPARPQNAWRFVRQAVILTALNSLVGAALLVLLDSLFAGALVGEFLLPLCLYALFFVNVDFWEFLWLGLKRPGAAFVYTSGRVLARMAVVIVTAVLSGDVGTIIWALVALEAMRLVGSAIAWRRLASGSEPPAPGSWREQVRFCAPVGVALGLAVANKSAAGLFIVKTLGPLALAHYVIGTYVDPIVNILRNSLSDALLPEMAESESKGDPLRLWRRTTVIAALLLLPTGIVLICFAEPIVVTLFSRQYLPAAAVLQIYPFVLLRECFDFGVALRAINRTSPIIASNGGAIVLNLVLLFLLVPKFGLVGAVVAFVTARLFEGMYLARRTMQLYNLRLSQLACWGDLGRVALACAIAAIPLWAVDWIQTFGIVGAAPALLLFLGMFAVALRALRLPEAMRVFRRLRRPIGARF